MARFLASARPWLFLLAIAASLGAALPPAATYARQYAFARALQFVIFAVVTPALLVIGWPSRAARADRPAPGAPDLPSLIGRAANPGQPAARAATRLLPFLALAIAWRLPVTLQALERYPALTAAELVTLVGFGSSLWLELARTSRLRQPLPRLLRAAMAAVAMWTIWTIAYITAMFDATMPLAREAAAASALTAAIDRQIAVAIMWAVPAIFFMPVVFSAYLTWLGEREGQDQQARRVTPSESAFPGLGVPPRAPRGWRVPPG